MASPRILKTPDAYWDRISVQDRVWCRLASVLHLLLQLFVDVGRVEAPYLLHFLVYVFCVVVVFSHIFPLLLRHRFFDAFLDTIFQIFVENGTVFFMTIAFDLFTNLVAIDSSGFLRRGG